MGWTYIGWMIWVVLGYERKHVALCFSVVISKVSHLLRMNYHELHENTLIKKRQGESAHLPLGPSADKFIGLFCLHKMPIINNSAIDLLGSKPFKINSVSKIFIIGNHLRLTRLVQQKDLIRIPQIPTLALRMPKFSFVFAFIVELTKCWCCVHSQCYKCEIKLEPLWQGIMKSLFLFPVHT